MTNDAAMSTRHDPLQHAVPSAGRCAPSESPPVETVGELTRILVVDDILSAAPVEHLLHGLGYWTTRTACCGEAALTTARDFSPSVVLLCLDLPDMSAYDVAQRLRERTKVRGLRLIALTGDYAHIGRDLAREAGFERYLAKPVNVSELRELLRADLSQGRRGDRESDRDTPLTAGPPRPGSKY